MLQYHHMTNL